MSPKSLHATNDARRSDSQPGPSMQERDAVQPLVLRGPPAYQVVDADQRDLQLPRDGQRIAGVVAVVIVSPWIIRNLNTARQKIVGPVSHPRSRSKINYFDRALALANQRNIEARKSFTQ